LNQYIKATNSKIDQPSKIPTLKSMTTQKVLDLLFAGSTTVQKQTMYITTKAKKSEENL
jgi:hypothetical protein